MREAVTVGGWQASFPQRGLDEGHWSSAPWGGGKNARWKKASGGSSKGTFAGSSRGKLMKNVDVRRKYLKCRWRGGQVGKE